MNLNAVLGFAKKTAIIAGNKISSIYDSKKTDFSEKKDKSPLTEADLAANKVIVSAIKEQFPEHGILTEEEEDNPERLNKELVWIIDPLDGTKEFLSRNGEFTVNIALVQKGIPVLGVICVPAKDDLFFAVKDRGSFFQKRNKITKLSVSKKEKISDMTLVKSRSHASDRLISLIERNSFREVRTSGSSIKGCLVAKGAADVYYRFGNTNEWDICAMDIIVKEAGGKMTDLEGNSIRYNKENVLINGFLVSNNMLHEELLSIAEKKKSPVLKQDRLKQLEAQSIYILREAYSQFKNLIMLWSIGKDSTVLLWLARKAFFGHAPFPLVHIDTGYKIPEMLRYRDELALRWHLDMIFGQNTDALKNKNTFPDGKLTRIECCRMLKTEALRKTLSGEWPRYRMDHSREAYVVDTNKEPYTGVILGIRADEEGTRSKERYFSPRDRNSEWDVADQPPELWNQFKTDFAPGTHIRIHPLLDWTELDIWKYIRRENVPVIPLYFSKNGKRYRSLGCYPCTKPVPSEAKNYDEIIDELASGKFSRIAERSGREQDKEGGNGLETLRREGYM